MNRYAILILGGLLGIATAVYFVLPGPLTLEGEEALLNELSAERVALKTEWRTALRVDGSGLRRVELGPIPESGILRLGILGDSRLLAPFHAAVFVGSDEVLRLGPSWGRRWLDARIDLSDPSYTGQVCSVVVRGPGNVYLSPIEIIQPARHDRPNVLIHLIDTLRQDHLGVYGYHRDTSPALDSLAADGLVFTELVPQSSWTRPSVATLLTSQYPHVHGAEDRGDLLREGLPSLAEALGHSANARYGVIEHPGYDTLGIMTNPNCLPEWGFGHDFMRYMDVDSKKYKDYDDKGAIDAAMEYIRGAQGRPWFIYLHTMGPHTPYRAPHADYRDRFLADKYDEDDAQAKRQRGIDLYDGEIAYTDAQFGRVLDELKRLGEYDDTLIVVVSDHGEEFGERGHTGHGSSLYEELLRVPLIVKLPGNAYAGETRNDLVQMLDLAPTILELVGLPPEPRFRGQSFADLFDGTPTTKPRIGYASLVLQKNSMVAAKTRDVKYISNLKTGQNQWFDLRSDSGEQHAVPGPIPGAEHLPNYIQQIASRGAAGLQILVTPGSKHPQIQVQGEVSAKTMGEYTVRYSLRKASAELRDGVLRFSFDMIPMAEGADREVWGADNLEQDNARIRVEVPAHEAIRLTLSIDGRPVPPEQVYLGAEGVHAALDGLSITPSDLTADAFAYDPANLPDRRAVYVWFVPDPKSIAMEDLDAETRDALQGLGYLE